MVGKGGYTPKGTAITVMWLSEEDTNYEKGRSEKMTKVKVYNFKTFELVCCNQKMKRLYVGKQGYRPINRVICLECGKIKEAIK